MAYEKRAQAAIEPNRLFGCRRLAGQAAIDLPSASARPLSGLRPLLDTCCGKRPLHAQAAVEVMSYGAFFLLIFVIAVAIFFQMQSQEISRAEYAYAQQAAYHLSDQIHVAFVAGPGFWQVVRVPSDLLGKSYAFVVTRGQGQQSVQESGFVYVEWNNGASSVSAPTITTAYEVALATPGFIGYRNPTAIEINSTTTCLNISNRGGNITFSRASAC